MRAMQLETPGAAAALREVRRADPHPGPDELLLEVAACAVCRTDLQLIHCQLRPRRLPMVAGR